MYKQKPFYKVPELPVISNELWIPITTDMVPNVLGYYFISNYGRVFSALSNKLLKQSVNEQSGYYVVNLYHGYKQCTTCYVHRLVMLGFCYIPGCEELMVNHKDTIKTHNWVTNLEWCTCAYNVMHASQNGLLLTGEDAPWTTLTDEQVHQICKLRLDGLSGRVIADMVGCKINRVYEILEGKSRTNISSLYGIEPRPKVYKYNTQECSTTEA